MRSPITTSVSVSLKLIFAIDAKVDEGHSHYSHVSRSTGFERKYNHQTAIKLIKIILIHERKPFRGLLKRQFALENGKKRTEKEKKWPSWESNLRLGVHPLVNVSLPFDDDWRIFDYNQVCRFLVWPSRINFIDLAC